MKKIINEAEEKSKFSPTIYEIYDKSNENICDRLIIVFPFMWFIWAYRGDLYILCPEDGTECGNNSTSAVRVTKKEFRKICLHTKFENLVESYKRQPKTIVEYEISEERFTIITALNSLLENFITFSDKDNIDSVTNNSHLKYIYKTKGKKLKPEEISKLLFHKSPNHHSLIVDYQKHYAKT